MKTSDRVEVLLSGFSAEDRIRLRPIEWAAEFTGLSVQTIYRKVADGKIPHVKDRSGKRPKDRRNPSAVRFRLLDLVAMTVENEVATPSILAKCDFPRAVDSEQERVA